jgi:hypothetical protein
MQRFSPGGGWFAIPFVIFYDLVSNFLFLNLFVALVLENFEYNFLEDSFDINEDAFDELKFSWLEEGLAIENSLNVKRLKTFVLRLNGQLAISASHDKFWYNRLLVELDIDAAMEYAGDADLKFHELLLALCKLRFGDHCLPFDEELAADQQKERRREEIASRIMAVFVNAWKMLREPPEHLETDEDVRRWRAGVRVARMWVLSTIINKYRLDQKKTWERSRSVDLAFADPEMEVAVNANFEME